MDNRLEETIFDSPKCPFCHFTHKVTTSFTLIEKAVQEMKMFT